MSRIDRLSRNVILLGTAGVLSGLIFGIAMFSPSSSALLKPDTHKTFAAFWFPGLIFGISFGTIRRWAGATTLSFATCSAIVYWATTQIALRVVGLVMPDLFAPMQVRYKACVVSGLTSGAFGISALLYILILLHGAAPTWRRAIATAIIGAISGCAFILLVHYAMSPLQTSLQIGVCSLAFVMWQSVAGMQLNALSKHIDTGAGPSADTRVSDFLTGPLVQLVGLIGSVVGLISFLAAK